MRIIRAAFLLLVLVGLVSSQLTKSECVFVPPTFQPSSQFVLVTALLDGKPVKGAQIDAFLYGRRYSEEPRYSFIADDTGVVAIRQMAPANYDIVMTAKWGWTADLLLTVSKGEKMSQFAVKLQPDRERAFIERALAASEKAAMTTRLPEFAGVVQDGSGAGIGRTRITAWKVGEEHSGPGTESTADGGGHFSISLPEGRYVALFDEQGFFLKAVFFEISRQASPGNLDVTLEVGAC
jgi:hypothetical protein